MTILLLAGYNGQRLEANLLEQLSSPRRGTGKNNLILIQGRQIL